jgi:hypothetical protein
MRPLIVRVDQHARPGAQIIVDAGAAPALACPSIIRHGSPGSPALAGSSVEQDLEPFHVLELLHEGAPYVALFLGHNDETSCSRVARHFPLHRIRSGVHPSAV